MDAQDLLILPSPKAGSRKLHVLHLFLKAQNESVLIITGIQTSVGD